MNDKELKEVQSTIKGKVEKHKEKIKLHEESKKILELHRAEVKQKLENLDSKILSSTKNIEYHTGKMKAYESVSSMLN